MRVYKGSFTIEAACVFPLVLLCLCLVIEAGISLQQEVKMEAISQMNNEPLDLIGAMYRRELVKELFEKDYED